MDSIVEDQILRLAFGSREGTAPFAAGEVEQERHFFRIV